VSDAADSIDERLGSEYGQYARRAADAVTGLADSLRDKDVDELFDGARNVVGKARASQSERRPSSASPSSA
jgi:hypothetical protein